MTVQELIDELNKRIKDKSKDIWAYDESGIYSVEEYDDIVLLWFLNKNIKTMTVQELIDELNKVKDKSKEVCQYEGSRIYMAVEYKDNAMLF